MPTYRFNVPIPRRGGRGVPIGMGQPSAVPIEFYETNAEGDPPEHWQTNAQDNPSPQFYQVGP